jgi:hypothetical protein
MYNTPPPGWGAALSRLGHLYISPSEKGKSNGRLLDEFDIFVWQGKCQIWNIGDFYFEKKVVVTDSV